MSTEQQPRPHVMPSRIGRRLAAIVAADVVGYSLLVAADEAWTLSAIKDLQHTIVGPLITEHHGGSSS